MNKEECLVIFDKTKNIISGCSDKNQLEGAFNYLELFHLKIFDKNMVKNHYYSYSERIKHNGLMVHELFMLFNQKVKELC